MQIFGIEPQSNPSLATLGSFISGLDRPAHELACYLVQLLFNNWQSLIQPASLNRFGIRNWLITNQTSL